MEGAVKLFGPHQRMARSGSVQAFQTSSRGAANSRVIVISPVALSVGFDDTAMTDHPL